MSKLNKEFDSITPPGHLEQRVKDAVNDAVVGNLRPAEKTRKSWWYNWRRVAALATALVIFASAILIGVFINFGGQQQQPWQVLQRPWQSLEDLTSNPKLSAFGSLDEIRTYVAEFNHSAETYLEYNERDGSIFAGENFIKGNSAAEPRAITGQDIMQTDGGYIYTVSYTTLSVIQAGDLSIKSDIVYADFFPDSVFLLKDKKRLVVLGSSYDYDADYYKNGAYAAAEQTELYSRNYWYANTVAVRIYDTEKLINGEDACLRELKFKNAYCTSAQMAGNNLHLSLSAYNSFQDGNVWIPEFYDSINGDSRQLSPQNIFAAPDNGLFLNYSLLAGVDVSKANDASVNAYLGSLNTIYASAEGVYTAFPAFSVVTRQGKNGKEYYDCEYSGTGVVRYQAEGTGLNYAGYNIVPGTVINGRTMDEFRYTSGKTYFRIATALNADSWITVFDTKMKQTGRLKGLSEKNEDIYSVSFEGETAMAVTRLRDEPLYIIDLSSPELPKIKSAVKIPGGCDYLQILDINPNYILTAGRRQDKSGNLLTGLNVSLFDAKNANSVREAAAFEVGSDYDYTDDTYGHKSMMHYVSSTGDYEVFAFAANLGKTVYERDSYHYLPDYKLCYYTVDKDGSINQKTLRYIATPVSYENQEDYSSYGNYYSDRLRSSVIIGDYVYLIGSHTVQRYNAATSEDYKYVEIWRAD